MDTSIACGQVPARHPLRIPTQLRRAALLVLAIRPRKIAVVASRRSFHRWLNTPNPPRLGDCREASLSPVAACRGSRRSPGRVDPTTSGPVPSCQRGPYHAVSMTICQVRAWRLDTRTARIRDERRQVRRTNARRTLPSIAGHKRVSRPPRGTAGQAATGKCRPNRCHEPPRGAVPSLQPDGSALLHMSSDGTILIQTS